MALGLLVGVVSAALSAPLSAPALAQSSPGIAIVSRDRVLRESDVARRLREAEQVMTGRLQAQIDAARAALDAEESDLAQQRAELTPEEFQTRATDFDRRIRMVRRVAQERGGVLQRVFQEARARLVSTLPEVLEKLRVTHGATIILDADDALAFDAQVDLTLQAIELFNAEGQDVEIPVLDMSAPLLPPPAAPAAPASDQ